VAYSREVRREREGGVPVSPTFFLQVPQRLRFLVLVSEEGVAGLSEADVSAGCSGLEEAVAAAEGEGTSALSVEGAAGCDAVAELCSRVGDLASVVTVGTAVSTTRGKCVRRPQAKELHAVICNTLTL